MVGTGFQHQVHANMQAFIPFLLTHSCCGESLESRIQRFSCTLCCWNEQSHVAMGGLPMDLGGSLWPTFWSSDWNYRRRSQQLQQRERWLWDVSRFGRGKPKSQLAMSNLRPDFFEWSGKPFCECVTLPHPSSLLGFDPKSYGALLKWGYPQIIRFNRIFHSKPSILWKFLLQLVGSKDRHLLGPGGTTMSVAWNPILMVFQTLADKIKLAQIRGFGSRPLPLPGPLEWLYAGSACKSSIGKMHEISCLRNFKTFLASFGVKRLSKLKLVKAQTQKLWNAWVLLASRCWADAQYAWAKCPWGNQILEMYKIKVLQWSQCTVVIESASHLIKFRFFARRRCGHWRAVLAHRRRSDCIRSCLSPLSSMLASSETTKLDRGCNSQS